MKIGDVIARQKRSISFEFFPPKNVEGEKQLFDAIDRLQAFEPSFVSVTYGAGGTTRANTYDVVERIVRETPLTVMPHLTSVNQTEPELREILAGYRDLGVENILALRGDAPLGGIILPTDGLRYGKDLVRLAASFNAFSIGVAVYPEGHCESTNLETDMAYTRQKVDAGADFAITQMFFDNRYYYDFMERAKRIGIHIPIIAGIMPITDVARIRRFGEACGATLPVPLLRAMEEAASPDEARKLGIDFAVRQAEDLLQNGFRYLHFYTLNRAETVTLVLCNLSLTRGNRVCVAV